MSETNRIEYKRELTDDLEKEVVAFLNYKEGGIIYVGIDDSGKAVGLTNIDDTSLRIKDRLKSKIKPSPLGLFDIVNELINGSNVMKIIVASGPEKPYHIRKYGMSEKGCFIRIGTAAEPMTEKMIEDLFSKRTKNSLSNIPSPDPELKFRQLRIYYDDFGKELNDKFEKNLGLLTKDHSRNFVAYLMSDSNQVSTKLAKYNSLDKTDLIESNELGESCLVHIAKRVLDKLSIENKTITKKTASEREDIRLWNEMALREAVINAFVHSDYTNEVYPQFEIFPDRLEITSPGGLPQGLSHEEFFQGFSVPRNKEIIRIFKD